MRTTSFRNLLIAAILIGSIVLWSWVLVTYGAEAVVAYIGAENGYLVMFLVALFGGMSSFSGVTYVATIITLASGGLAPHFLALAAGIGISIGDTIYYYIGRFGLREIASSRFNDKITRLTVWLSQKPRWLLFVFVYLYTGLSPLPNDILTIALGLTQQPLRVVLPALILGSTTLTYLIALFGERFPF